VLPEQQAHPRLNGRTDKTAKVLGMFVRPEQESLVLPLGFPWLS